MKKNKLKQAVADGRIPVGHMVWEFSTRGIAKLVETANLDFVLLDMEHSEFDVDKIADLIAWFKATDIAPLVRVPGCHYHFMARVMDGGALGVMIPNLETPEQARLAVNSVKYAPMGNRGVGLGSAHTDYLNPDPATYFRESNENTTIIAQVESPKGVANLEEIAATPGIDILWVGHFDLSQGMGIPAQFHHPDFLAAMEKVVAVARKHGKLAGIQPSTMEQAEEWVKLGFNVISWKTDSGLYGGALRSEVAALRTQVLGRK